MSTPSERLPHALLKRAIKYRDDYAWERSDAMEVLAWWRDHEVAILGVEVWIGFEQQPLLPTTSVYAFSPVTRKQGETHTDFVRRTFAEVHDYVARFAFDPADVECRSREPLFCFTEDYAAAAP
jgi:hypothetical protein